MVQSANKVHKYAIQSFLSKNANRLNKKRDFCRLAKIPISKCEFYSAENKRFSTQD